MRAIRWVPALAVVAGAAAQTPIGTVINYQGLLESGGSPASGTYDMRFRLFNQETPGGGDILIGTTCAENVNVSNGVFNIPLDFGAIFDGNQRWMEVSVRSDTGTTCGDSAGYTLLTGRQRVTAVPYALKVPNIDGHSLNALDNSPLDAVFVDVDGRTGMGTLIPQARLDVIRDWDGQDGALRVGGDKPSVRFQSGAVAGSEAWLMQVGSDGPGALQFYRRTPGVGTWAHRVTLLPSGNFGIGTASPQGILDVASGNGSFVRIDNLNGDFRFNGGTDGSFGLYNESGATGRTEILGQGIPRLAVLNTGNVGIGTSTPTSKLEIAASDGLKITGFQPFLTFTDTNAGNARGVVQSAGGDLFFHTNASLVSAGVAPLRVRSSDGATIVKVLEITGADLAEKFPTSDCAEPGMVVAIDAENAGNLCLARGAYNRRVAGVVSGANDFAVGAVLGNLPGHEDALPIALSGRVYVWCDASSGAIEPGDMLTTSETPGHAMNASDHELAHGAVIGKAMSSLAAGERGLVLVLVNLQ